MDAGGLAFDHSLLKARQHFLDSLAGRLTRVYDSLEGWRRQDPESDGDVALQRARRELHTLCGTAGTLGFGAIARTAMSLRDALDGAPGSGDAASAAGIDHGLAGLIDAAMDARLDATPPSRGEPSPAATSRIVVIDDDPDLLACTSLHLRCAGSEVIPFTDAARALSELDAIHADAVVTDLQMPYIDGADVVRDIRRRPYAADMPVIVYSAAMTPGAAAQMHALGADASVSKLDPPGELVDTVMRLLARRPAHAPALPDR